MTVNGSGAPTGTPVHRDRKRLPTRLHVDRQGIATILLGIWGVTLLGAIVVGIGVIVWSAQVPSHRQLVDEVTSLQGSDALLHDLGVSTYVSDDCRAIVYAHGEFSETDGPRCEVWVPDGQPFDQQASHDFATIQARLAAGGLKVWLATQGPATDGYSFEGSCSFCPDLIYVYAPDGYTSPPDLPDESRWFAITPTWYAWQDLEGGF